MSSNIKYRVNGMTCASCVNHVEKALRKVEGIIDVSVNLATETATIQFDDNSFSSNLAMNAVKGIGYELITIENNHKTVTARVDGMSCATCANSIDNTLLKMDGIIDAHVNLATEKVTIQYDDRVIRFSDIKHRIQNIGYKISLEVTKDETVDPDTLKMNSAKKRVQLSSTITILMMSLMLIHMFVVEIPLYTWIIAILGFPVIFIIGRHVHRGSYYSLKSLKPNMDVLVSLGSIPPYIIGLMGLFFPITTFIEMATTIMTFHLIGKFLESKAKGKASQAIKKLMELGAKTARILVDGNEIEVLTNELSVKDIMIIRPGEKIPTDGMIIEGKSLIDESIATGESMPVKKHVGDNVIGATINKDGLLKVEVTKVGKETFLSQVIEMVEACQGSKVPIQEFADRITSYFVPAIMVLTVLTFSSFLIFQNFHLSILEYMGTILPWINTDQTPLTLAFITATAVLVIACPCALGLGTPTALMVGSGVGAEKGILIRNGEAVQTLKDIKAIAFDKTGTLTYGKPVVTDKHAIGISEHQMMHVAGSLETGSEHPLAMAIIEDAKKANQKLSNPIDFEAISGMGIKGILDNKTYYFGNRKLIKSIGHSYDGLESMMQQLENEAKTVMILADDKEILGLIAVADALKPEATYVIRAIENLGITTAMITGDNSRTALAIAKKAGITRIISDVLPEGKVSEISKLQSEFGLVAMVGDGINDAPALKQANVGIAIGTGTDIAKEAADVTLVSGELHTLLTSIQLSKAIFKKIKQNYFWAWFYNAIAIPFAMLGLLHPMIGAAAMSISSLNVIYNSLRLKKHSFLKVDKELVHAHSS
jgi:Cu+-exporting ATPase